MFGILEVGCRCAQADPAPWSDKKLNPGKDLFCDHVYFAQGSEQTNIRHLFRTKCFEVSSTGYINARNKSTLTTLHSFLGKDMKKSVFLSNLNSLAWYGSYQLWLTREDKEFADPPFLIPHIK